MVRVAVALLLLVAGAHAASVQDANAVSGSNPIRKVVNLLQAMQKKVSEEGAKEKQLYDKYNCWCITETKKLNAAIEKFESGDGPQLDSTAKEADGAKAKLQEDLKTAKSDRESAKTAISNAESMRAKENDSFNKLKAELESNIAAIKSAVAALSQGAGKAFIQSVNAIRARQVVESRENLLETDRETIMDALNGKYVPVSHEVIGMLKTMGEQMQKDLDDATSTEMSAIESHNSLVAAKEREIELNTQAVETKSVRVGELGVESANAKNDYEAGAAATAQNKQFLAGLTKSCADKKKDFDERTKTRSEELVAIADTIKMLNSDDALEIFKNTLSLNQKVSLLQVTTAAVPARKRAASFIMESLAKTTDAGHRVQLQLLSMALRSEKVSFEKVIAMIDEMIKTLKGEQANEDGKKDYCNAEFSKQEAQKAALERKQADADIAAENAKKNAQAAADDIAALQAGIAELDKNVAAATEQRQSEHTEYTELITSNNGAKDLLNMAVQRLNKFYNPSQEKKEASFLQIGSYHAQMPAEAPETYGEFRKNTEGSNRVLNMLTELINELDKEMAEAKVQEVDSQGDFEKMVADATAKRKADVESTQAKAAAKAEFDAEFQAQTDNSEQAGKELAKTVQSLAAVHGECDWLLANFEVLKKARTSEQEAMERAKQVLKGAKFD